MSLEIDSLKIARKIFGSRLGKAVLKRLLEEDPGGFKSRLDHVLRMFAEGRGRASFSCMLDYYFYKLLLEFAVIFMHMSKEEFVEGIRDPAIRRGMELIFKSILKYGVTVPQKLAAPFLVVWNFTNLCNLRCRHCYQDAGLCPGAGELTFEEKMMVLEQIDGMGIPVVALSGGEPTIHPHFLRIVEEGARRGIYMAVATNGVRFADKEFARQAIRAGLRYVEVSLDSIDPRKHDAFRGVEGVWEKAVKGIKNVIELGGGRVSTGIAMTVTRINMDEVRDMMKLGEELGVTRIIFFNFIPTGRGREISELDLSPEEREEILKKIYRESLKPGPQKVSTAPQLARVSWQMSGGGDVLPTHFTVPKSKSLRALAEFIGGCGAGRIYLALQPDGVVTPCVFLPIPLGSLRKEKLQDIWENNEVVNKLKNRDLLRQPCGSCEFRYICGGCRARAYAYLGDYLAHDPGCLRGKLFMERVTEVSAVMGSP